VKYFASIFDTKLSDSELFGSLSSFFRPADSSFL